MTQVRCNSKLKAPDNCLQYFTESTGTLTSFNFAGGTHLANQDYCMCVRCSTLSRNYFSSYFTTGKRGMPALSATAPFPQQRTILVWGEQRILQMNKAMVDFHFFLKIPTFNINRHCLWFPAWTSFCY